MKPGNCWKRRKKFSLKQMGNKEKLIEKLEKDLLAGLLEYAIPFLNRKVKTPKRKDSINLENIVLNSKPKISLEDFRELENSLANFNRGVRKIKTNNLGNISYSFALAGKKESSRNYSVAIKYEENGSAGKLKIEIRKDGKKEYSAEIINEKEAKDKIAPYKFTIFYEDRYGEERLSITYQQQLRSYMKKHSNDKEDMTNRVPLKWLNILPESMMGGVLGFTYLGENFMGRRADLTGWMARMVDIHESIHTPDEYETRVLTSWIMERARSKYVK